MNPALKPYLDDDDKLLALCVWREARGCNRWAKLGVANVVKNRCAMAPARGFKHSIPENVLKPFAFSSFNEHDVNSTKFPEPNDPSWLDSLAAAQSEEPDNTGGAVFYFSPPLCDAPRAWGKVEQTVVIDSLHFFKIPENA